MASRKRARRRESEDDFDNDDDNDDSDVNDSGAKWACQSCTFQNRFGAFRCHVCGARKGTSTRKARLSENVVEMQKTINDMVVKQVEKAKAIKRIVKPAVSTTPNTSFAEPSGSAPRTPAAVEKVPSPTPSPSTSSSSEITAPPPKKFKEEVPAVKPATTDPTEVKNVIGIAKPPDAVVKVVTPTGIPKVEAPLPKAEAPLPKAEAPLPKAEAPLPKAEALLPKAEVVTIKKVDEPPIKPSSLPSCSNIPSTSTEGPSTLSVPTVSRPTVSPRVSPTTSRQSSETDSSSDSSAARSIEPPSNDRSPNRSASTRIPDYMIHREIAKKIIVVANGVPAVFYEFPRKIPGASQSGLPF